MSDAACGGLEVPALHADIPTQRHQCVRSIRVITVCRDYLHELALILVWLKGLAGLTPAQNTWLRGEALFGDIRWWPVSMGEEDSTERAVKLTVLVRCDCYTCTSNKPLYHCVVLPPSPGLPHCHSLGFIRKYMHYHSENLYTMKISTYIMVSCMEA